MSMRGEIISREYQSIRIVKDRDGKEYSCYFKDVQNYNKNVGLTADQKSKCLDLSQVLGDTW